MLSLGSFTEMFCVAPEAGGPHLGRWAALTGRHIVYLLDAKKYTSEGSQGIF